MKLLPPFVMIGLFVLVPPSNATNYYVPGDFPTIQQAIDAAGPDGDFVFVSPGYYPEDIVISAKTVQIHAPGGSSSTSLLSARWTPNDPSDMTGGSLKGFHVLGQISAAIERDLALEACVVELPADISASYQHNGTVSLSHCSFLGDVVLSGIALGRYTIVESCNFLNQANLSSDTASLVLDSCALYGGGVQVYVEWSDSLIQRNILLGGPGMEVESGGAFVTITDNTILDSLNGIVLLSGYILEVARNLVAGSAYGINVQEISSVEIRENELRDCGTGIGGAIYNPVLQNTIYRCVTGIDIQSDLTSLIAGNTVVGCSGTGIRVLGGVYGGGIERNIAVGNGSGFELSGAAEPALIRCNDAWGNGLGNWIGISDPTGQNGNISADPLFCDVDVDDYRLRSCSPCADGECQGIGSQGLGCYCPAGLEEAGNRAHEALLRCSPNPFRNRCVVDFDLERAGWVRLAAYDVSGDLVSIIFEGALSEGRQHVEWRAVDRSGRWVSSGAYYLRLDRGAESVSLPIIRVQ